MQNPLLAVDGLPPFSQIIPDKHIEPALREIIEDNQRFLAERLQAGPPFTWENFFDPFEEVSDRLTKMWSPISHLHGVAETPAVREAYKACLPLLTDYSTKISQNSQLFAAIESLAEGPEAASFSPSQKKLLSNELRDFKLAGVHLSEDKKAIYADLRQKLSELTTKFSENLIDATQGWYLHITDKKDLENIPESDSHLAAHAAREKGVEGWVFSLEFPMYLTVMKNMTNRSLRRTMYHAYVTRASDQGPTAGKWDNTGVMDEILKVRHELATLLGFNNYAEFSLATKMADSPKRVLDFLNDLVQRSRAAAQKEFDELEQFAKETDGIDALESWDIVYYSEKLRRQKYDLSQEELKKYFPIEKVMSGLFAVVNKLYGIKIYEKTGVDIWHPSVKYYEIFDENGEYRGGFYTDLYARAHKKDGAWMDECRVRRVRADGSIQLPVAYLTCNFTPTVDDKPALLTQDEVETLFHEFGHCLHHLLTKVDYGPISGINGVPWDAVEFPSQLMERWCWEAETMPLISSHYQTGESLPHELHEKIMASKNFQSAMQMVRQLEFALFDFRLHLEYDPKRGGRVQSILNEIRKQVGVVRYPEFNRFQNSFSHIFAGGYAAGYYSYKWAEILSSDAYSLFEETGVFNPQTGKKFLENILMVGGAQDPMTSFVAFRGREPSIDALLRHNGLLEEQ